MNEAVNGTADTGRYRLFLFVSLSLKRMMREKVV